MMLEWFHASEPLNRWNSVVLLWNENRAIVLLVICSVDQILIFRDDLYIHLFHRCLPSVRLHRLVVFEDIRAFKLIFDHFCLLGDCQFTGQLVLDECPLLPQALVSFVNGQMLLDQGD